MIIKLSCELANAIERLHCSLDKPDTERKKSDFINLCEPSISSCVSKMSLEGKFDEIALDSESRQSGCVSFSDDRKKLTLCLDNIENSREVLFSITHALGHADDFYNRGFDYGAFLGLVKVDLKKAFFVWDIFLDGRLAGQSYYSYFHSRGLYYDYKVKFGGYFAQDSKDPGKIFEDAWNKVSYGFADIKGVFEILSR